MIRSRLKSTGRTASTLTEVLIASALVGGLMVAALDTLGGATRSWLAASESLDSSSLADDLMAEIIAQHYSDPDTTDDPDRQDFGTEADEISLSRADYDDLDDYDDWSASPPEHKDGSPVTGYIGWTRAVVVQKLKSRKTDEFHTDNDTDRGARLVTVTVTEPGGATTTRQAVRCYLGGLEQVVGVDLDAVTNLSVELEAGAAAAVQGGVRLRNHADGP